MATKSKPSAVWFNAVLSKGERIDPFNKEHKPHTSHIGLKQLKILQEEGIITAIDAEWIKWLRTRTKEEMASLEGADISGPPREEHPLEYEGQGDDFELIPEEPKPPIDSSTLISAMALLVGEIFQPKDKSFQLPVNRFLGLLYCLRRNRCEELGGFRAMGEASNTSFQAVYNQARHWESRLGRPQGGRLTRRKPMPRINGNRSDHAEPKESTLCVQQALPFFEGEPGFYHKLSRA